MKINKVSVAIIAATAVLAISPAVMAQTTNRAAGAAAGAAGRGGRNALTVESLDKTLTLTEAEKPKVKSALEEYTKARQEAMQADQSERRTKMMAAQQDLDKKLKEILSEEQYKKYEAMPRPGRGNRNRNGGGAGGAGGGAGGGNQ